MTSEALSAIKSALAEKHGIAAEIDALRERVACLSAQLADATERRRALVESELSVAGQRLLDGEKSVPPDPKLAKEIRDLGRHIEAISPAIAICEEQQAELRQKLAVEEAALAKAIYQRIREIHDRFSASVRSKIAEIVPELATLAAADNLRKTINSAALSLGPSDVDGDFSGNFVAASLLSGITLFVRPELLDEKNAFECMVVERGKALAVELDGATE